MANFEEIDTNPSTSGLDRNDKTTIVRTIINYDGVDRDRYTFNKYAAYGTTAASDLVSGTVINTSSLEETNEYLEKSADIYKDPNPQIIRQAATASPVTYEQRVHVRYLQPPAVPEPGPLIIKEVRPQQPSPPPPLVIRQHAPRPPSPPPLILRERPPTPPPRIPSETIIHYLPEIPVPPRSVVIEHFPPPPEKPRDIIIERWIPYEPQPQRRTILQRAPSATIYPERRNPIVMYEAVEVCIIRRFRKLGVMRENPANCVACYDSSLLDTATLVQKGRNAGVYEDTPPPLANEIIIQGFSLSGVTSCEGIQRAADTEAIKLGNTSYSSSASNLIGNSALADNVSITQSGFYVDDASLTATDTNHDGQLKQIDQTLLIPPPTESRFLVYHVDVIFKRGVCIVSYYGLA
ncbi:unnamed protein product [Rotaria sordida]|uniref:Uncharacterized protein n=1 Tax=Rotaria sordida TaxID=392033 RepID=A0A814XGZ7_9BILA|nr:unnamed protein product [Rotaria sordida]